MYSPNTQIICCNTPLSSDGENQLKFTNKTTQKDYFLSCAVLTLNDFTFQRQDGVVNLNVNIESLYTCNYIMYKNTQFSNKYFYAYITNLEYVNEKVTKVHIKTDVFQTWQFDLTYYKSFVDRQHELDNYNTIADTPAQGQLIEVKTITKKFTGGYFVFCTSDITQDVTTDSPNHSFQVGGYNIPCWVLFWENTKLECANMASTLQRIANHGWGDRIISATYCPYVGNIADLKLNDYASETVGTIHICEGYKDTITTVAEEISFDFSYDVDYLKELTYPYAKIVVTDCTTGSTIELSPDKFIGTIAKFQLQGTISETPSYKIIPKDYTLQTLSFADSLVTKCNTSLPIVNNLYAKYLMQNGEINNNNKMFAGLSSLGAIIGKNPSAAISGVEQIINITAQENKASKLGNQVSAITDGVMERVCFNNEIKISLFMMDSNHAKMCRNFWKMYGYPVHTLDNINLNSKSDYNFVKLVNPNISGGNVPQNDLDEICKIFEKGVTLWHTTDGFRNY